MNLIFVSVIVLFLAGVSIQEELKTITIELKRKVLGPDPADFNQTNAVVYSESEMKRRGLATIEKTLSNYHNLQYFADLYIGDSKTQMSFLYDTGSSYLWIPLHNWTWGHKPKKYTPAGSFESHHKIDAFTYGQGAIIGTVFSDNVRINDASTPVKLRMLGVYEEAGLRAMQTDGILGMAPAVKPDGNEQLLVQRLYEEGIISANVFGVGLQYTSGVSKLVLGGYDTSIVTNSSLFSYVDLMDTKYWSLPLHGMTYGDENVDILSVRAIIDTGTSLTYWQSEDWPSVYNAVTAGKKCGFSSASGYRSWECTSDTDFEDISFHMGDYRYYLPTSAYVYVREGNPTMCEFYIDEMIVGWNVKSVLLGDVFMRNYYILHDSQNLRIGMYGTYTTAGIWVNSFYAMLSSSIIITVVTLFN